jgi:hypothetical protein
MLKVGQVKDAFGQVTFGGNLSDGQVVILVNVEPWRLLDLLTTLGTCTHKFVVCDNA